MYSQKCAVCWNESDNENKIFVPMPHAIRETKRRHDWFWVYKEVLEYTTKDCYLCEDHFNLKEDTVNYDFYTAKKAKRLIFKANALPIPLATTHVTNFDNSTEIRNIEQEPVNVQIKEEPMDIKTENYVEYDENNDQSIINNNSVNYYTQTVDNVINLNNYGYVNNVAYVNNDNNIETFNSYDNGMNGNIVLNNQNILAMIQSGELKIVQVMPTMAQASTSNVTTTAQSGNVVPQLVYINNPHPQQNVVQQELPQQYQPLLPAFVNNVQVKTELTQPVVTSNNVYTTGVVNNSNTVVNNSNVVVSNSNTVVNNNNTVINNTNVVVNNNSDNVAKPIRNVYACAKCHELFYTIEVRNLHYLVKHIRGNLAGQKKPNKVHVKQEFIEEEKKKTQVLVRKLTNVGQAGVKQGVVNGVATQMVEKGTEVVKKQQRKPAVKRKLSGEVLEGWKKNRQMIRTAGNGGGSLKGTEILNKPTSIANELQCITCGHQAGSAEQLQEHCSLHDVFKCVICHQTLEKRIYANHMLEHREEPPEEAQMTSTGDTEDLTSLSTNRVFQQKTWLQEQHAKNSTVKSTGEKCNEENTVEESKPVSPSVGKKKRRPSTGEISTDYHTLQHCNKCGKLFSSKQLMKQHRRSCLLDDNFTCLVCFEEFKTKWLFTDHQRAKRCSLYVQCPICKKPILREKYSVHVQTRHPLAQSRHECSLCHVHFPNEQAYRIHLTTKHRNNYKKTLTKFKNTHGHTITAFKPTAGNLNGAVDTATLRYGKQTSNVKFNLETIKNIKQAIVTQEDSSPVNIALEDIGKTDFSKLVTVKIGGQAYRTYKTDTGTIKLVRIDYNKDNNVDNNVDNNDDNNQQYKDNNGHNKDNNADNKDNNADNNKDNNPGNKVNNANNNQHNKVNNEDSSEAIIKISADGNDPFKRLVYGCQFCDATFRSKNVLRQHYMRRHSAVKADEVTNKEKASLLPVLVKTESRVGKQIAAGKVRTPTPPPPLVKYNHEDDEKLGCKLELEEEEEKEKIGGYKVEECNLEVEKVGGYKVEAERYEEKLVYEEGNDYGESLKEEFLNEEHLNEEHLNEEIIHEGNLAEGNFHGENVDERNIHEELVNAEELVDEENVNYAEELVERVDEENVSSEGLVDEENVNSEELVDEENVNSEELMDEENVNSEELVDEENVDTEELVDDGSYEEADIEEEIVEEESNERGEVIPEGTSEQGYYLDSEELVFEDDTPDFVNLNMIN